jgi:hypothetical protein
MPAFGRLGVLAAACGLGVLLDVPQPSLAGSATAPLGVSPTIAGGMHRAGAIERRGDAGQPRG